MKFKGFRFRVSKTVVTLAGYTDQSGEAVFNAPTNGAYVRFGRVCKPTDVGAEATNWSRDGQPVFAKPIKVRGMSLTNMAYGADGKVYVALNGRCYSAVKARTGYSADPPSYSEDAS